MKKSVLFAALMALPLAATAEGLSYNYVEFDYTFLDVEVDTPVGNFDGDADGFTLGGVFSVHEMVFVQAAYSDAEGELDGPGGAEFDFEGETWILGVGAHTAMNEDMDLFGSVNYVDVDDDDGFGLEVGLRTMFTPNFEGNISYSYVDIADGSNVFSIGGVYTIAPNWGVVGEFSYSEEESDSLEAESTGYTLGIRYDFQM